MSDDVLKASAKTFATAQATLEIERAVDLVRARFFDMAHTIRTQPHDGIVISRVETSSPSLQPESRYKQEIQVMDRTVVDEFVINEGDDGTWEKRIVAGENVGARFVAQFDASELGTRVTLSAFAPEDGFTLGLGKLSALGIQRTLRKWLDEMRADLLENPTRPASPVLTALERLSDLTAPLFAIAIAERRPIVATMLEAASVVAITDDEADAAEQKAMIDIAAAFCDIELGDAIRARMIGGAERALATEGLRVRCERIGERLKKLNFSMLGLAVATIVADVSHGLDPRELAALEHIARAAGVDEIDLGVLLERIDDEITRAEASSRDAL